MCQSCAIHLPTKQILHLINPAAFTLEAMPSFPPVCKVGVNTSKKMRYLLTLRSIQSISYLPCFSERPTFVADHELWRYMNEESCFVFTSTRFTECSVNLSKVAFQSRNESLGMITAFIVKEK